MKLEFPYYDVVAVLIPGFTMCCSIYILSGMDSYQSWENVNFGSMLVLLIISYFVGQIILTLSKVFIEFPIFRMLCGGRPMEWMGKESEFFPTPVLQVATFPKRTIYLFQEELKEKNRVLPSGAKMRAMDLVRHIVNTVKTNERQATSLAKTRAEEKMFRSFCLMCLVSIIYTFKLYITSVLTHNPDDMPPVIREYVWYIVATFTFIFIIFIYRYCKYSVNFARKTFDFYYCAPSSQINGQSGSQKGGVEYDESGSSASVFENIFASILATLVSTEKQNRTTAAKNKSDNQENPQENNVSDDEPKDEGTDESTSSS